MSYGATRVGDTVADTLKRQTGKRVSYDNTKRRPYAGPSNGKFGGLPGGPNEGSMNTGGKRRPVKAKNSMID